MGKFYSIPKTDDLLTIDVDRCLEIIEKKDEQDGQKKPVSIGKYENEELTAAVGRYGPYISYKKKFYSLPSGTNISELTVESALKAINESENKNVIKKFPQDEDVKVMKGKFGPYIAKGRDNFKIPKEKDPESLTFEECTEIMSQKKKKKKKKR
jgi:DNA topoisomerase-1